jgi:RNA polymerase sigma factor (TIGR02999 family)
MNSPTDENQEKVTQMLRQVQAGNREALDELFPIIYKELRRLASSQLAGERSNHTLQPTALVHEAYMRLIDQHSVNWQNRAHFFSIAAETMRRILVNHAVQRNAQKRGSGVACIELDEAISYHDQAADRELDLVLLDDALKQLEEFDPTQAKIVELRFFGGLTVEETAEVMKISESTVKREWRMAKSWLKTKL